jgi:ABC-type transport system involved in multi-copper enzyme maturation permease subunit
MSLEARSSSRARPLTFGAEVWVVFRQELRRFLLSWRTLVPMCIYAGFAALALLAFHRIEASAKDKLAELGASNAAEEIQKAKEQVLEGGLKFVGWGDAGDAAEIIRDQVPVTVLAFFMVCSYFLVLLVAMVSFDQFSELSTRGARFALMRIRRSTYFAGKAAAAAAAVAIFLLAMWLVVAISVALRSDSGEMLPVLRESARAWLLMCVLALPYLSITALISTLARPGLAFVLTLGAWIGLSLGSTLVEHFFPWMLTKFGLESLAEAETKLLLLFPWEHAHKLISRDVSTLLSGVVGLLLIAAFGYGSALYVVRRRDV